MITLPTLAYCTLICSVTAPDLEEPREMNLFLKPKGLSGRRKSSTQCMGCQTFIFIQNRAYIIVISYSVDLIPFLSSYIPHATDFRPHRSPMQHLQPMEQIPDRAFHDKSPSNPQAQIGSVMNVVMYNEYRQTSHRTALSLSLQHRTTANSVDLAAQSMKTQILTHVQRGGADPSFTKSAMLNKSLKH